MRDETLKPDRLDLFGTYFDTLKVAKSSQRGGSFAAPPVAPELPLSTLLEAVRSMGGRAKYSDLWKAVSGVVEGFLPAVSRLVDLGLLSYERPQGGTDDDVVFILTDRGRESLGRRGLT